MAGCSLGEGMESALQGLETYLTDSAHNAQLFTTLAVVDTIVELTGGPLTASLMAIGRRPVHAFSDGYRFLASGVCILSQIGFSSKTLILGPNGSIDHVWRSWNFLPSSETNDPQKIYIRHHLSNLIQRGTTPSS